MNPIKVLLVIAAVYAPAALATSPGKLAEECRRGFAESCEALRAQNAGNPQGSAGNESLANRLADECRRGFEDSCEALRGLNGEKTPRQSHCVSRGHVFTGGSYSGTTVCDE